MWYWYWYRYFAANKIAGIRAALCHDTFSAHACREHNDANILTMGNVIGPGLANDIVTILWKQSSKVVVTHVV